MKASKITIIILASLVAVFFLVGFFLPKDHAMERNIVIQAPLEVVYVQVAELPNWSKWFPFDASEPTNKTTYTEQTSGVRASFFGSVQKREKET